MPIQIDRSEPNVIQIVFPPEPVSDDELAGYISDSEASLVLRNEPFVIIVHTGSRLTLEQRKMQGDFMNRVEPVIRRYCRAYAFIVDGAVARGILTAVLWRAPPPCEWRVFTAAAEGVAWARAKLEEEQA